VLAEIDDAVEWALAQPFPDPATLTENVYESS
jgi:TPP-dependent pyruvate/acetoin dehydrogenase alpha subunit